MCLKASPQGPACCSSRTSAASPDRCASTRNSTCMHARPSPCCIPAHIDSAQGVLSFALAGDSSVHQPQLPRHLPASSQPL